MTNLSSFKEKESPEKPGLGSGSARGTEQKLPPDARTLNRQKRSGL
jgi:hypothetical protein